MPFLSSAERTFLQAVRGLADANPFLPEHTAFECAALGDDFQEGEPVWSLKVDDPERPRTNIWRIVEKLEPLCGQLRQRLLDKVPATAPDLDLYEFGALRLLYQRFYPRFLAASARTEKQGRWSFYREFLADWRHFFDVGVKMQTGHEPAHTFACFRQIQFAFDQILRDIIGGSLPAARLRASGSAGGGG